MAITTSPYFRKGKRATPSQLSSPPKKKKSPSARRSSYFCRSPISCHGSIARLGPLIFALSEDRDEPKFLPCQKNSTCTCCTSVVNDVLNQFFSCEQFPSRWKKSQEVEQQSSLTCWEKADQRIQESARHLCSHRCYMRAFAPVREWIALRKDVHERGSAATPTDLLFSGWKCKLSAGSESENESLFLNNREEQGESCNTPPQVAVVFVSSDGKRYSNKNEAVRAILDQPLVASSLPSDKQCLKLGGSSTRSWTESSAEVCGEKETKKNRIVDVKTPLGLLEELFSDDPWKLLMSTIFLNRTSRVQVDTVLFQFLQQWPTPEAAAKADPASVANVIRPMGMTIKRSKGIIRFSKEYLDLLETKARDESDDKATSDLDRRRNHAAKNLSKDDIQSLFHCGAYAYAAYQIFIRRGLTDHQDHALTWYIEYQRACGVVSIDAT